MGLTWDDLPAGARSAVLDQLGTKPLHFTAASGGFSPGLTGLLDTADGQFFVKAISNKHPAVAIELVQDERDVLRRAAPPSPPVPALCASVDTDGWIVLVSRGIDSRTPDPFNRSRVAAALDALSVLATTPLPRERHLPTVAERYGGLLDYVAEFVEHRPDLLLPGLGDSDAVHSAESAVSAGSAGACLVHGDLRSDNVMIDQHHSAWLVDWAWGCRGQPWIDAVTLVCGAETVDPAIRWSLLEEHPLTAKADPRLLWGFGLAIAAMYARRAREPPPPGVPGLRSWQAGQAADAAVFILGGKECEWVSH
jgi:aminoglycoside phosphotransferase (APT) family kinase protein